LLSDESCFALLNSFILAINYSKAETASKAPDFTCSKKEALSSINSFGIFVVFAKLSYITLE